MNKNIQIDSRTHIRLKKEAAAKGLLLGRLAAELLNYAMDAKSKPAKVKP
jgi:hypothetical protein